MKKLLVSTIILMLLIVVVVMPGLALAAETGARTDGTEITDIAYLATNAGAIIFVTGVVQVLKISSTAISGSTKLRILVWTLSFIVLLAANWVITGMLSGEIVIKCVANSVLVALGCFGAYNVVIEPNETEGS